MELPWIDPNDPNYESDSEKADSPKAINGKSNIDLKPLVPELSEEDVRKAVEPLILEYFENSDSTEVLFTLQEMLPNLGARRWMVVTITVELAMDHKPSHRELASVLISDLYQKVISQRDIGKGKGQSYFRIINLELIQIEMKLAFSRLRRSLALRVRVGAYLR